MKKLIIFAHYGEARALIEKTQARICGEDTIDIWVEERKPCLYQISEGWIALCGVGIHAAQMAVAKYSHLADIIWNLGICGSLKSHFPVGELFEVQTVGKYIPLAHDLDARSKECLVKTLPNFNCAASGAKLISSDFPVFHELHREALKQEWDLVDMEGYGIAYAAAQLQKPVSLWKLVSDFAKQEERASIQQKKALLSEQLANYLLNLI